METTRKDYTPQWADTIAFGERDIFKEVKELENSESPAAYVYRLLKPATKSVLIESWEYWHDEEPPSWAWAAFHSDEVYYVGGTSNIWFRVQDHSEHDRSAKIMSVFPRWKLDMIEPCKNKTVAFERERQLAVEYESENRFVFQA